MSKLKKAFCCLGWLAVGIIIYCLLAEIGWIICRKLSFGPISQPIDLFRLLLLSLLLKIAFGKKRSKR